MGFYWPSKIFNVSELLFLRSIISIEVGLPWLFVEAGSIALIEWIDASSGAFRVADEALSRLLNVLDERDTSHL